MLLSTEESTLPSPQFISNLFGFPSLVIASVVVNPAPPCNGLATNVKALTKVLFLTLLRASFKPSKTSVTLSLSLKNL